MPSYTAAAALTRVLLILAAAARPWGYPGNLSETKTGLSGHYLVLARVVDVKPIRVPPRVPKLNIAPEPMPVSRGCDATLRVLHTYASPAHQVHGAFDVESGDVPYLAGWSISPPRVWRVLHLGEVGIWCVSIVPVGPPPPPGEDRLALSRGEFHAFPARKGLDKHYAQAVALADAIERADSIESDEEWIAYLEKNAMNDNELIAGWAGELLARRGGRQNSLQPFLLAHCSRGRYITSQVPIDEALSRPEVLGDIWRSSPARVAMVLRWFSKPASDADVPVLNEAMHLLAAERALSGISKEQLREILSAARAKGVIPETGQTELASWLACAVCSYPDDAPLISMALGEIQSSKNPSARRCIAYWLRPRMSTSDETTKAILAIDPTMTRERIRGILETALADPRAPDGRGPSR